jgi:membrane protease YdiL (CAAX protease family)
MQPLSLVSLSILGILFSFFYYRSKSIYPSSAAHFTNNFIALFLLHLQSQNMGSEFLTEGNIPLVWVFISTLAATGLLLIYLKLTKANTSHLMQA